MRRFIRWALMAASVAALGCGVAVPLAAASAAATPACTTTVNWIGLPGDGAMAWIRWARAKAGLAEAERAGDTRALEARAGAARPAPPQAPEPEPVLAGVVLSDAEHRKAARDAAVRAHPDMAWLRSLSA